VDCDAMEVLANKIFTMGIEASEIDANTVPSSHT
jgi:hypothetical protein